MLRTRKGCQPSPARDAGSPAGMPEFTSARVPGGVVASLLDHRLHAGKPPASWQMDAEVTWDVATRVHVAVAHPLRLPVGTQPAATHLLGDRELPSSLREDLEGRIVLEAGAGPVMEDDVELGGEEVPPALRELVKEGVDGVEGKVSGGGHCNGWENWVARAAHGCSASTLAG